jgi:NAD-dependent deacetylase
MRPHIVWFGEAVPALDEAIKHVRKADLILIIGTSLQVYPAASLFAYAQESAPLYYIDPKPYISPELKLKSNYTIIDKIASIGMQDFSNLHIK